MKPQLVIALPTRGHYIVAVSGGVDSVALLHMLVNQPAQDLRLRVAHVNHGLRPDAASDERFVRQLAATYGLPYDSVDLDLGRASEAAARQARYDYLFALMTAHRAGGVITAHHADDQLETSLFNTLRGSGRHGQAARLQRNQVLRPLLHLTKADLLAYAKHHRLAWREDLTNQDTTISRNFIRHELLDGVDDYAAAHRSLADRHVQLNQRLDSRLAKVFSQYRTDDGVALPRKWLASQSWTTAAALVHYALRKLAPETEFSRRRIEDIVRQAKTAAVSTEMWLTNGLKLQVGYDTVAIVARAAPAAPLAKILLVPQTSLTYGLFRLSYGSFQDALATSITLPMGRYQVRTAQSGDRMTTVVGTKKLHDIFVDKKVARDLRPRWPVITDQTDQILWLPYLMTNPRIASATEGYQLIAEEV